MQKFRGVKVEKSIQQQNYFQEYAHCLLCPRKCAVNRMAKKTGVCGQTDEIKIARAALQIGRAHV